jgi:hemoglobin-like flavoprotein
LTPEQIELIRTTWATILPIREDAAVLFYEKLFELNPALRILFPDDLTSQRTKFMTMLDTVVRSVERIDALVPAMEQLGQRHARYGAQPDDYDTIKSALLWTLEQGLQGSFNIEVRHAWATMFDLLATTMQSDSKSDVA